MFLFIIALVYLTGCTSKNNALVNDTSEVNISETINTTNDQNLSINNQTIDNSSISIIKNNDTVISVINVTQNLTDNNTKNNTNVTKNPITRPASVYDAYEDTSTIDQAIADVKNVGP